MLIVGPRTEMGRGRRGLDDNGRLSGSPEVMHYEAMSGLVGLLFLSVAP